MSASDFYIEDGIIVGYRGEGGDIAIPGDVKEIADYAFSGSDIKSLTAYNNLVRIGDGAFSDCAALSFVKIGSAQEETFASLSDEEETETEICESAFSGCTALKTVELGSCVKSVGKGAFEGCKSLESMALSFIGEKKNGKGNTFLGYIFGANKSEENEKKVPKSLKTIVVTGGAKTIGNYAFFGCSSLTRIEIPGSVTSIGNSAFSDCTDLSGVTIPEGVTSIGDKAFYNCCGLASITIPVGVKSIGNDAFISCGSLTSITLPDSVTDIGESVFDGCSNLSSITLPESLKSIKKGTFGCCRNLESITIPESVTDIGASAFYGCSNLEGLTVPKSVTSIGKEAFAYCGSLESITLPSKIAEIGESAFQDCESMESVEYGGNIADWCNIKFGNEFSNPIRISGKISIDGAEPTNLVVPKEVKEISAYAFVGCETLTRVQITDGTTKIGKSAFEGSKNIKVAIIADSVKELSARAFAGCENLASVVLPESTKQGKDCFSGCPNLKIKTKEQPKKTILYDSADFIIEGGILKEYKGSFSEVVIPDGVTVIGDFAFGDCDSIKSVSIPDSVTSIGKEAFYGCSGLTSITIPNSVTNIGADAFANCSGVEGIETVSGNEKYHSDGNCIIETETKTLIAGCKNSIIPTDGSVTSIGYYAFYGCSGLTNITIPNSVTSIDGSAFSYCSSLTSITIPNSVIFIGTFAFSSCTNLASITVASGNIMYHSSGNCIIETKSKTIIAGCKGSVIPSDGSVTNIRMCAFSGCSGLTNVTIPRSVSVIGMLAFSGCTNLTSITVASGNIMYHSSGNCIIETDSKTLIAGCKGSVIPSDGSVTSIGDKAFYGCSGLTSITIPNSVTSIGEEAFKYCSSLTSISLPDGIKLGKDVFKGCDKLKIEHRTKKQKQSPKPTAPNNPDDFEIENGVLKKYTGSASKVVIPDGVKEIGKEAFENCGNIKSVTIPDSVTSIGNWAFSGCKRLTSITIPDSVTSIGDWAFRDCSSLEGLTIPNSVTSIGDNAVDGCSSLESITVESGNKKYHSSGNCIIETESKTLIAGCKNSVIPSDGSVSVIGDSAFSYCSSLTSITIPDSVTSIGDWAFSGCKRLTSITIPDSVTSIGVHAFHECSSLTSITYKGTKAQWKKIKKGKDWKQNTGEYVVHCIDGDIKKFWS